jgi:hypothetical protein
MTEMIKFSEFERPFKRNEKTASFEQCTALLKDNFIMSDTKVELKLAAQQLIVDLLRYLKELEGKEDDTITNHEELRHTPEGSKNLTIRFIDDSKKEKYRLYFASSDPREQRTQTWLGYAGDKEQTAYEMDSNMLKVAARSKKDIVGKWITIFLRMIYDDLEDIWLKRFVDSFTGENKVRKYNISKIIDIASEIKVNIYDPYINSYYTNMIYFPGEQITINRYIGNMDTWDIDRIRLEFGLKNSTSLGSDHSIFQ